MFYHSIKRKGKGKGEKEKEEREERKGKNGRKMQRKRKGEEMGKGREGKGKGKVERKVGKKRERKGKRKRDWKEKGRSRRRGKKEIKGNEKKGADKHMFTHFTSPHNPLRENVTEALMFTPPVHSALAPINPTSVDPQHVPTDGHLKQMCMHATENIHAKCFLPLLSCITFCAKLSSHQVIFRKALLIAAKADGK